MRRTYGTSNNYGMQHNAEVGLFTTPSKLTPEAAVRSCAFELNLIIYGMV